MTTTLTPAQIRSALERLATILAEQDVTARIDVFGGASLALVYSPDRTATADVDGAYHPGRRGVRRRRAGGRRDGSRLRLAQRQDEVRDPSRRGRGRRVHSSGWRHHPGRLGPNDPGHEAASLAPSPRLRGHRRAPSGVQHHLAVGGSRPLRGLLPRRGGDPRVGHTLLERAFGEVEVVNSDPPYTLPPIVDRSP